MACTARPSIAWFIEGLIIGKRTTPIEFKSVTEDIHVFNTAVYRKYRNILLCAILIHFAHSSVPFFFEPNFDALVKPLAAIAREKSKEGQDPNTTRKPIVYGDFLVNKVGNNFAVEGKGRYDS
jgi:hypothetical protein